MGGGIPARLLASDGISSPTWLHPHSKGLEWQDGGRQGRWGALTSAPRPAPPGKISAPRPAPPGKISAPRPAPPSAPGLAWAPPSPVDPLTGGDS